jgi:DNA-binding MurR/RpiR family transcriptional regulator
MGDDLPAPETYEDLRTAIAQRFARLSDRLQRIARHALAHPDSIALDTVAAIARRAAVQPSSLIRFARAFGYGGFSDMQLVFRRHLVARSPDYGERLRAVGKRVDAQAAASPQDVLMDFVEAGIQSLHHLGATTEPRRLEGAIAILDDAPLIHVVAQRRSFPVATYLAYSFSHLGCRVHLLDGVGGMLVEQTRAIGAGDALVAISFPDYAPQVLEAAAEARRRGARVVAITDGPLSPLLPLAAVAFEVEEVETRSFRSLTASMCLALSLVIGLGYRRDARAAAPPRASPGVRRPA